jgi:hypothetical protein
VKVRIYGSVTSASTGQVIPSGEAYGSGPETWESHIVDGAYSSGEVEAGTYQVEASAPGYVTKTVSIDGSGGGNLEVNMTLEVAAPPEMGKIGGQVTDKITTDAVDNARIDIGLRTYYTAANGTWESGDLEPYTYTVRASKTGYVEQTQNITVIANQVTTANFVLEPTEVPVPVFDCTKPPTGYGFFQPLVNAMWYLFCPMLKGILNLPVFFKQIADFLTNITQRPEQIPAKMIEGLYAEKSPSVASEIIKNVADGSKKTVQLNQVWVFDLLDDFVKNQFLPDLKEIREETEADLDNDGLSENQIIDNALERAARIYTHFIINSWLWEMCTAGQIEAMSRLFDNALAWTGLDKILMSRIDAKMQARVVPKLQRQEDGRFKVKWFPLQDYQRMVVREKISLEDFYAKTDAMGIPRKDAEGFWNAHYEPPNLDDIITFNLRYPDKAYDFKKISIISDLDPAFEEVFKERFFEDPALSLVRFMFETGDVKAEEVEPRIIKLRYKPEDAHAIAGYIINFQARLFRRRYLLSLARLYELGKRTVEQVKTAVAEAKYTESVAEWIIKNSDLRKEIAKKEEKEAKPKQVPFTLAIEMWAREIWNEDDVKEEIEELAYEEEDREDLLTLARQRMEEKKAKLAKGEEEAGT